MRQRKLGSHTPPCHRRMVITTLFSVFLAALQRRGKGGGCQDSNRPPPLAPASVSIFHSLRVCLPGAPDAPGIHINVPVVHPNALPLNITPSSSRGTPSTNDTTKHNLNTCPQKRTPYVPRLPLSLSSWLLNPCRLGPHVGGMAISCLLRVPMVGRDRYGYITPACSGSLWWGEINMATSSLPSRGPHCGDKST